MHIQGPVRHALRTGEDRPSRCKHGTAGLYIHQQSLSQHVSYPANRRASCRPPHHTHTLRLCLLAATQMHGKLLPTPLPLPKCLHLMPTACSASLLDTAACEDSGGAAAARNLLLPPPAAHVPA